MMMMGIEENLLVLISLAFFLSCSSLPAKEISQDDLFHDEMKVENERNIGIDGDINPFDRIQKVNEEQDVTGLYEGDIKRPPLGDNLNQKRNTVIDKTLLWVGKVVPYIIDSVFDDATRQLIESVLAEIQNKSCLTFKPRQSEACYLNFIRDQGCWSFVGRYLQGINNVSIGSGCERKGIIMHEIFHALGFWHEQSRGDRGKFIEIFWENIRQGVEYNFDKNTDHEMLLLYDYNSIMHYGPYAFSSNGKKTIVPIKDPAAIIGQRDSLSANDIAEVNALYDCQSTSTDFYSTWGEWWTCDSFCYKKRQRFCSDTDFTKCPSVSQQHGVQTESAPCTYAECYPKIDGHWGKWSSWSSCSKSCDEGQIARTRKCDDPAPANGGAYCSGSATNTSQCKARSCSLGPDDCEFELGYCGWANEKSADQLDWILKSGSTPSAKTGPVGDHTAFGHGSYIYMEASSPAITGQKAILVSKMMAKPSSGTRCLTFWYHMYGSDMGTLTLILTDAVTMAETTVLAISGSKGNQWNKQEIDINIPNNFQLKFMAERGTSYESDIAIDDIFFTEGSCNPVNNPLGMEDKRIKDYQISSSSDWDFYHRPQYARLNQPGPNQWCAHWNKHGNDQFVRVDFEKRQLISGVSIQGQATFDNWVTSYKIKYTTDGYSWKAYQENGIDKIFTGATSRNAPVKHPILPSIQAFGIMINPQSFHGNDICLRMEIYGKEDPSQPSIPAGCSKAVLPLGMASGRILDSQITATSIWDANHQAYNARLNSYKVWCASDNAFQHVMIDLGRLMTVYAIATQGHPTWDNYVTSYEVSYSENGSLFYNVLSDTTSFTRRVFPGNTDRHSIVRHKFSPPLKARYVQIEPKSYLGDDVCLRAELYGCE